MSGSGVMLPTLLSRMGACNPQDKCDDFKGGRSKGSKGSKGSRANRAGSKPGYFQLPARTVDDDGEATPSRWSQGSPMHHLQTDFSPMYTCARHQNALFAGAYAMPSQPSTFPFAPLPVSVLQPEAAPCFVECAGASFASPHVVDYMWTSAGYVQTAPVLAVSCMQPSRSCEVSSPDQLEQPVEKDHAYDVTDVERTSIMIRNLPDEFKRGMIMEMLESQGLAVYVDFVYLPTNLRTQGHFGYAFVNFTSNVAAMACIEKLDGFSNWSVPCEKICEATWSLTYQGWRAHVERYRNSRIMHENVDDEYKPAVFTNGVRAPFPPPTKSVRAPRLRKW